MRINRTSLAVGCAVFLSFGQAVAQDDKAGDLMKKAGEVAEGAGEKASDVQGKADELQEKAGAAKEKAAEVKEKVDGVIADRAKAEEGDGEPSDADVGEASYNVEDCMPADGDGEESDAEADDEDTDAAGEGDATATDGVDACEPVVK